MKKILQAAFHAIVAGALAVSVSSSMAQDSSAGGTLVYGKVRDARALDPGVINEGNSSMVVTQMFESLLALKPGTSELMPWLAESYSISRDLLEVTFNLRPGVKFHDGTAFNADAVVFSLKRQHDKAHPFNKFGPWRVWSAKGWGPTDKGPGIIKDIVKVNEMTVKVLLNQPDVTVINEFAHYGTAIVSPTAAEKFGEAFKSNPVGTGPFQFAEWKKDSHVAVKRFEGYWGTKARLAGVIFKAYPDEQARILALKKGEADMIDPTGPEGMKTIEADPNLKLQRGEINTVGFLALNSETGPFVNTQLRQAFNYAVNRKVILDSVYGRTGVYEKLPMPSLLWGYDKSVPDYEYNPDKARALIKASGVATPIKVNLIYLPAYRPYNPNGRMIAEILQAQLKEVGIEATPQTFDLGTYFDNMDAGKFDVAMAGWTGGGDPDEWMFTLFTEGYLNTPRWKNKEYTDLVTRAKRVASVQERTKLYSEAQKILMREAPVSVLARGIEYMPMNAKVQGWVTYPSGLRNFSTVSFSK
jgi:ABC-type transport system substrate-binding protein